MYASYINKHALLLTQGIHLVSTDEMSGIQAKDEEASYFTDETESSGARGV